MSFLPSLYFLKYYNSLLLLYICVVVSDRMCTKGYEYKVELSVKVSS